MNRTRWGKAQGAAGAVLVGTLVALGAASCSGNSEDSDRDSGKATTAPTATTAPKRGDALRLNQIQVIGSHNSFHVAAPAAEYALLEGLNPEQAKQRTYSHPSITTQFADQKIRQIELDIFADSKGGLYATPSLRRQAGLAPLVNEVPEMAKPGTKVLHEQDVDYHSVCPTLVACLTELKTWSDANPTHVPVAINIQFKDGPLIFNVADQAKPEKWTAETMRAMDAEIASVFPVEKLITPDDIRGSAATLEQAVLADGWPTLSESRGKVMFLMVNGDPYRSSYLKAHPDLKGAILFTNADPGQPDASFIGVDDPVADASRIKELVTQGYLVRTRSDEPDVEGRTGDTTRRNAALASGAQWISTDYPGPDGAKQQYDTAYIVKLPGFLAARCNPVTAPKGCDDATVEP